VIASPTASTTARPPVSLAVNLAVREAAAEAVPASAVRSAVDLADAPDRRLAADGAIRFAVRCFKVYTGNHSSNPYDAYSTVPTLVEREGDLSALGRTIVDPATQQPFANNQIPAARLDPSAQALLALIPVPNQTGERQNFRTVETTANHLDDVNVRIVHLFGGAQPQQRGQGNRGGGRGGLAGASNLNIGVHFRHSETDSPNPFPALGGTTRLTAWDVPVGLSFTKGGMLQTLRVQFNRQRSDTQNLYAFNQDIAGQAGVNGVSTDPFDWGAPNLSFSTFGSVRDMNPAMRIDRTIAVGDTVVKTHGPHTFRFGGDYRDIRLDSRTDPNARGSFVFTGLYTGVDFADFLMGLPQQATAQFGPGLEQFHSVTGDLFVQDDWRVRSNLTVNVGLRYEYYSPYAEADNRLLTLDVAPGFVAVAPTLAGTVGPYSGPLPDTIVRPDRTAFAPRIGIAWKPQTATVVRAGYGVNYNSNVYQRIVQQLATQPPFASTTTVLASALTPVSLADALVTSAPGETAATYSVDPDYRLGSVQIWNADVQHDIARTISIGVGYTGTKGASLDVVRAPNRGPDGLLVAGVQAFLFESSEGDSIMHALSLRVRQRLTRGFAAGATYTFSKSTDDASAIGGVGDVVVAQNDLDLAAERGLSSFDQRHRFAGDFTLDLPFGAGKRWLADGAPAAILGNWQMHGNLQLASGTPFTARVLGAVGDVAGGVNGTLRADYNGQPISVSDPSASLFFNTAAFSVPLAGTFGNASRNTIIGPGISNLSLGMTKTVSFSQTRVLAIQILASDVSNDVQFATIDTVVNSPTFGQVTSVRPMRRIQILTRLRF
jgi:trimeric autotransporter adhesin